MIIINQPHIYSINNKQRLEAVIEYSDSRFEKKLWYEVDEEYGSYLCEELSDSFLLALIPVAVQRQENIHVLGNVSPQLLEESIKLHIPLYAEFLEKSQIKVSYEKSIKIHFDGAAVATGGSLGIDSLSTIIQHISEECPDEQKLTHLTIFNSSQLGNIEGDELSAAYLQACRKTISFAEEIGLGFVGVNSNIPSLINENGLNSPKVFHFFTISCVMSLQKLFKTYYYSSGINSKYTKMAHDDMAHFESLFVSKMGNENVEIVLSDHDKSRVEKTSIVAQYNLAPRFLDVCWADQTYLNKNGRKYYREGKKKRNCGWCEKCLRTLYTLELLGEIEKFSDAFDMEKYYQYKKDYVIRVVANAKYNEFYKEIIELMNEKKVKCPKLGSVLGFLNVRDSKVVLMLWQGYNTVKRNINAIKCNSKG